MSKISKRKILYCSLLIVFLSLTFIGLRRFSKPFADGPATCSDVVLLWEETHSYNEALHYIEERYPELTLVEHSLDYSLCRIAEPKLLERLLPALNIDSRIVLAEPDYEMELFDFEYPDDPYASSCWAFDNPGFYIHYYSSFPVSFPATEGIDMNIWDAWENYPVAKEQTRTVTIAIIDTGVDYKHPDLKDQMWVNTNEIPDNGIDDDGNGYIDDIYGWDFYHNDSSVCHYIETANGYAADPDDNDNHGTHIAGIIGATANNSIGIAGVASNVNIRLMSLKIHGGTGSSGSVSNAIKAIRYAEAMGADICNMSWGTNNYSQALELVMRESPLLFVTAAGNNGINNNSTPVFPSNFRLSNLISVAYIDCNGMLDPSSNYGVSTVDIAAPGKDIYSTLVGAYGYSSGSSMAAPHVTGLAAMLYAYQENIYPSQIKELIINTMMPLDNLTGYLINPGIPNAGEAIRSMTLLQADTEPPFLALETSYEKASLVVHLSSFDAGGSGIRKIRYAFGNKTVDFFTSDSDSTAILGNRIELAKGGYYTFYVEDYAGNARVQTYHVEDDTIAPELNASYKVSPDYTYITVSITANDPDSGLKSLKYLVGEHNKDVFSHAGEELSASSVTHTLFLSPDISALTICVTDYRGNSAAYVLRPTIVPATALHLNLTTRSLYRDDTFQLAPLVFPWNSTDGVTYYSLNPSVVTVSPNGLVTATGPGEAMIAVTTHSGVSAYCRFIVSPAE